MDAPPACPDLDDERRFALNSKARSLLGCGAVDRLSVMTAEIATPAQTSLGTSLYIAVMSFNVVAR